VEKTFFSYLRTSIALSMAGVVVAQLLVLQHSLNPSKTLGFHLLGTPLACIFEIAAILVILHGACRFWTQQEAVMRGKIMTGGWGMLGLGMGFMTGTVIVFILTIAIGIDKERRVDDD
jgi:uncharacterized membrane protein YidH (DUF202 family)